MAACDLSVCDRAAKQWHSQLVAQTQRLGSLESEVQKRSHSDAQTWTLGTQTQKLKLRGSDTRNSDSEAQTQRLGCSHLGYSDSDAQTWMLGAQAQRLELGGLETQNQRLGCSDLDTQTQILRLGCLELSLRHSDARSLRSQMLRCSDAQSLGHLDAQMLGLRASDAQVLRLGHLDTYAQAQRLRCSEAQPQWEVSSFQSTALDYP
jgi:hypothetical protein